MGILDMIWNLVHRRAIRETEHYLARDQKASLLQAKPLIATGPAPKAKLNRGAPQRAPHNSLVYNQTRKP